MDKFVVRTPRGSLPPSPSKRKGYLKQATLESLKGVVVVEEMERAKVVLERSDTSSELKVDTLEHLLRKNPAKEVLIRTKLGKTVHKLCRAQDEKVAAIAKQVYKAWKTHILSQVNRPTIEVKCDVKTQNFRNSARKMLLEALQKGGKSGEEDPQATREQREKSDVEGHRESIKVQKKEKTIMDSSRRKREEEDGKKDEGKRPHKRLKSDSDMKPDSLESLAEYLEREVFQSTERFINNGYRRTIRSMVFCLRHQPEVTQAVTSSTLSVADFVKQHKKV